MLTGKLFSDHSFFEYDPASNNKSFWSFSTILKNKVIPGTNQFQFWQFWFKIFFVRGETILNEFSVLEKVLFDPHSQLKFLLFHLLKLQPEKLNRHGKQSQRFSRSRALRVLCTNLCSKTTFKLASYLEKAYKFSPSV